MQRIELGERPARREDLTAWYESALDLQARSGLSVTDFAARAGVSAWTLYEWRRRLSRAADQHEAPPPRLVEVAVVQETPGASSRLSVHLRNGHRVDVPSGFDTADLHRLIGVLESC